MRRCSQCVKQNAQRPPGVVDSGLKIRIQLPAKVCADADKALNVTIQPCAGPVVYALVSVLDMHRAVAGTLEVFTSATADFDFSSVGDEVESAGVDTECKVDSFLSAGADGHTTLKAPTPKNPDRRDAQSLPSRPNFQAVVGDNVGELNRLRLELKQVRPNYASVHQSSTPKDTNNQWTAIHTPQVQSQLRSTIRQANLKRHEYNEHRNNLQKNLNQGAGYLRSRIWGM